MSTPPPPRKTPENALWQALRTADVKARGMQASLSWRTGEVMQALAEQGFTVTDLQAPATVLPGGRELFHIEDTRTRERLSRDFDSLEAAEFICASRNRGGDGDRERFGVYDSRGKRARREPS